MKACTDIEQSKKLAKLGINIDTSDMYFEEINFAWGLQVGKCHKPNTIPAWSLAALIDLMPERIKIGEELSFCLASKKSLTGFSFGYNLNGSTFVKDNPLDAAFEMICWLKENGKI